MSKNQQTKYLIFIAAVLAFAMQPVFSASGKEVYNGTCIACHGADGKGVVPGAPDFTASDTPLKKEDAVFIKHMMNGFQSEGSPMAMPPKGGNAKLKKVDMVNVLKYMRKEFKP